jgi:hypothetical protein
LALKTAVLLLISAAMTWGQGNPPVTMPGNGYILSETDFRKEMALAKRKDGEACYILHQHFVLGLGQYHKGDQWLRRSAQYGYPRGMWAYGISKWNVADAANSRSDKEEALQWIRRAADSGEASAVDFLHSYESK